MVFGCLVASAVFPSWGGGHSTIPLTHRVVIGIHSCSYGVKKDGDSLGSTTGIDEERKKKEKQA